MTDLDRDIKRLLVETALAAPNYGLFGPAHALLGALPALGLDAATQALTTAMVQFGLFRPRAALKALKGVHDSRAPALRQLIVAYLDEAARKKRALIS